jgi:hypothetical protein
MKSRLMYIELKSDGVAGPARIARVTSSKTGATLYCDGRTLAPLKGHGFKANYFDTLTSEEFWISGPRSDGCDSLFPTTVSVDRDVREEYWRDIRGKADSARLAFYKSPGRSKRTRSFTETGARRRDMDRRRQPARFEVGGNDENDPS